MTEQKILGIVAEFGNPADLLQAARRLRDSKYSRFDCHSPFPIHGMDQAMGEKRSMLGWIVGIMGLSGLIFGITLEWWTSTVDYPIIISGKPFFSYQAYGPVAFAFLVISGSLSALLGMLIINKLPRFHHPVFYSSRFHKVTDDGFFVSIEATDPEFNADEASRFLQEIGGSNIELLIPEEEKAPARQGN
jgi:hypothetical protein